MYVFTIFLRLYFYYQSLKLNCLYSARVERSSHLTNCTILVLWVGKQFATADFIILSVGFETSHGGNTIIVRFAVTLVMIISK